VEIRHLIRDYPQKGGPYCDQNCELTNPDWFQPRRCNFSHNGEPGPLCPGPGTAIVVNRAALVEALRKACDASYRCQLGLVMDFLGIRPEEVE
jgi:hypothetical protein